MEETVWIRGCECKPSSALPLVAGHEHYKQKYYHCMILVAAETRTAAVIAVVSATPAAVVSVTAVKTKTAEVTTIVRKIQVVIECNKTVTYMAVYSISSYHTLRYNRKIYI